MKANLKIILFFLLSNYSFSQCNYVFVDNGGATGNYLPNTNNYVYTYCPETIGSNVSVTFNEFDTEESHDGLYIFNGSSIYDSQIASSNGSGYVPGGLSGSFWGIIPVPFTITSTSPSGCLTFSFKSDGTNQSSGWLAYVNSCALVNSGFEIHAFLDSNANAFQDANEYNFPLGQLQFQKNGGSTNYLTYSNLGRVFLSENDSANIYDFNFVIDAAYNSMYTISNPTISNVTIGTSPNVVSLNFPITLVTNYNDLAINCSSYNQAKAGFNHETNINYTNYGNNAIDGSVNFNKDIALSIVSTSEPVNSNPTGFTYNFTNLLPFQTKNIFVTQSIPPIPFVSIGQLITNSLSISTSLIETTTTNNNSNFTQAIVASYDPNDITESHGEKIVYSTFSANEYLNYTIRYENTGTTTASNIKITDVLNSKIDETSIKTVSSSHQFVLNRVDNNLIFNFENIYLPVSVANTNIGKGFITFKAKLKPGFVIGDVIPNKSNIYFDNNPAIETNIFETEFVTALSNSSFTSMGEFILAPNPTTGKIFFDNSKSNYKTASIYNYLGQEILSKKLETIYDENIDLSTFDKGVYIVKFSNHIKFESSKIFKN